MLYLFEEGDQLLITLKLACSFATPHIRKTLQGLTYKYAYYGSSILSKTFLFTNIRLKGIYFLAVYQISGESRLSYG